MTLKEVKNNTIRNIVRLALAKKYVVTIPKLDKDKILVKGTPLRIKKENKSGTETLKYFLDNISIKKLNVSILENSIVIYDENN